MFSETLKDLRKRAGLTQEEMAERIGLGLRQYQDLEKGAALHRKLHMLAVDMASIQLARERRDYRFATEGAMAALMEVYGLLRPMATVTDLERRN